LEEKAMTLGTLTRERIKEALHANIGLSMQDCDTLLELVLKEITDTLAEGGEVKMSSFGTFSVREKGERKGRNPKTGEEVPIAKRRVVTFRASPTLKDRVERGGEP